VCEYGVKISHTTKGRLARKLITKNKTKFGDLLLRMGGEECATSATLHLFQILEHVHLLKEMVAFIKVRIESEKAPPP
jgi:hypothetical protein